jgi:hypothetical protein
MPKMGLRHHRKQHYSLDKDQGKRRDRGAGQLFGWIIADR